MVHVSLFSGIGGFDLAAEWMGWRNVASCELNEFGHKVLSHYWPNAYPTGPVEWVPISTSRAPSTTTDPTEQMLIVATNFLKRQLFEYKRGDIELDVSWLRNNRGEFVLTIARKEKPKSAPSTNNQ